MTDMVQTAQVMGLILALIAVASGAVLLTVQLMARPKFAVCLWAVVLMLVGIVIIADMAAGP